MQSEIAGKSGQFSDVAPVQILRFPDVIRKTGIPRTGIYEKLRSNEFPEPVSLGRRSVGFVESEIDSYLNGLMNRRQRVTA